MKIKKEREKDEDKCSVDDKNNNINAAIQKSENEILNKNLNKMNENEISNRT